MDSTYANSHLKSITAEDIIKIKESLKKVKPEITILMNKYLPKRTILISEDIYEEIKK